MLRRAVRRATVGPGERARSGGGRLAGERSLPYHHAPDLPAPAAGGAPRVRGLGSARDPAQGRQRRRLRHLGCRRDLVDLLRGRRQGLLWPYHSGTLVTCIDSALVLQGFRDPAGVEALEIFASGRCGYLPQLRSEEPERDRMTVTPQNRYWCQPDYGTTCLVTALRAEAGLERLKVRMISGTVLPRRVDGLLPGDVEAGWTTGKAATGGRPLHRGIAGSTQELSYPARRNFSLAR